MRLDELKELSGATVIGVFKPDGTTELACEGYALALLLIACALIEHVVDNGPNEFSDAIELICAFHEESDNYREELKS